MSFTVTGQRLNGTPVTLQDHLGTSGTLGHVSYTVSGNDISFTPSSAGSDGSVSPSGAVNVAEGSNQTFTITPDSRYRINFVTVNGVNQGVITTYTFTNVTTNHAINATFTYKGGGGSGGGSSTPSTPATPTYKADVKAGNSTETTLPVTVDGGAGSASVDAGSQNFAQGRTVITIPSIPDVSTYSVGIPVPELSTAYVQGALTLNTDAGSIMVPSNMLTGTEGVDGDKAQISIGKGDRATLPNDVRAALGDKPLIQLTLSIDGRQTNWNNPNAPVTVSIPYTPTAAELANPESIVIWYIDGSGNVVTIPNGHYDPATGMVTFSTTHFSNYAVAYNKVSFNDVTAGAWYHKAVSFIAARGITGGTGNSNYSPNAKLTRGEFIVMLMRAYGIEPYANPADNFSDAGQIASWAKDAMTLLVKTETIGGNAGMLNPTSTTTRAEMVQVLYNLLKR
ncbi:S-layer homology domain-containing protein [Sedimentibacter hydroxybenzoicus]|uniref:S-layer homology domain-containing protein n=1 Tax=Sedimentibacter hydroxybenzoicus TaxID=29345 RepID=UPI002ADD7785|nr:S-layer homology domain-containing protein [Sedimentibacter hydroxybenzoicus]